MRIISFIRQLKRVCLVCIAFLFSSINVYAEVRLEEAKILYYEQDKYLEALQLVSPCLKVDSPKDVPDLEECLYFGNSVSEKAMEELNVKQKIIQRNFNIDMKERSILINDLLAPYKKMGITPVYAEPHNEYRYQYEFFKRLKELFPKSKYRAEYEYILLNNGDVVCDWEEWLEALNEYIKEFPNSKYTLRAKLDLAYNYDDLWNLIHPDHDWSNLVVTFPKDEEMANDYKQKALQLYKEILDASEGHYFIDIRERIVDLKNNKVRNGIHVLRCYD